jgi:hypothetical protein
VTSAMDGPGSGRSGGLADRDPGSLLCEVFIEALPIVGATISVVARSGHHSIVGASDALAARVEATQFELGVGPHWDALRTERPVFLYDVAGAAAHPGWLPLAVETARLGAAALFAIPLRLGAATVGVADLYSDSAVEPWSNDTIGLAADLAVRVTAPAVRFATRSADAETSRTGTNAVELRREVHQATGMVMAQLDCDASTALLRLRAHAFASGAPLQAVARDVVLRRLDLSQV